MLSFPPLRKPHEFQRRSTTVVFHIPRGEQIKVLRSNQFEIFVSSCRFEISASGGNEGIPGQKQSFGKWNPFLPLGYAFAWREKGDFSGIFQYQDISQQNKTEKGEIDRLNSCMISSISSLLIHFWENARWVCPKKKLTKQRDRPSNSCLLQLTFR